jgi:glycosyltransferase involved in cell wall biosynthesis
MNDTKPLVSVLMTAFNRSEYIVEAIESVLASTYENFELIVVDDCSTDNTEFVVKAYVEKDSRVKYYKNEENLGDYPNRNKAASYANGKYIKYIDSDNIIYPFGLDVMVDCIEKFPQAGYGLLSESDPERPYPVCASPRQAYIDNFFGIFGYFGRAPDSSIIRIDAFKKVGGFSGKNLIGDLEMWMKLSLFYPVVKIPAYLGWDRVHGGQQKNIDPLAYQKLRDQVVLEYFGDEHCPLNRNEVEQALSKRWVKLKRDAVRLLLSGKYRLAAKMFLYAIGR